MEKSCWTRKTCARVVGQPFLSSCCVESDKCSGVLDHQQLMSVRGTHILGDIVLCDGDGTFRIHVGIVASTVADETIRNWITRPGRKRCPKVGKRTDLNHFWNL